MVNKTQENSTTKKKKIKKKNSPMAPKPNSKSKTKRNPYPYPSPSPAPNSPYSFRPGTQVEISSDEDGFRGSWYTGTVLRRCSDPGSYVVRYHRIFEDDAGKVPLEQEFDCGQLRPVPPVEKGGSFKFGDGVDAFYNDGWWEGDVVEEREEDGKLRFGVFFMSTKEKMYFGAEEMRVHREWENGVWKPALEEKEDKEDEQDEDDEVEIIVKVRPPAAAGDEKFPVGTAVEVSSDEEGFEGAWFPATVSEVLKGGRYVVQYKSLRTEDDSDFLKEEVDSGHIRPSPPDTVVIDRYKLLEEVDALYNECWWVGIVAKQYVNSRYAVYFRDTKEELVFKHSDLRPHRDWVGGKWVAPSKALKL